ncbi:MAG: hypothetical protein ACI4SH_08085, partial [Candidatus Scatosoma sp.]
RGILIYNSYTYANTFKSVSKITFSLAEKPLWHSGNETSCVINNLLYNVAAYTTGDNMLQAGSAAVATFNEIKVTKIVIEFNENDKLGNSDTLRVSEIIVLGK